MIKQMTARERMLATIVGLGAFAFVNIFLVKFVLNQHRQLRNDLSGKTSEIKTMLVLLAERNLWMKRDQWLQEKMTKLENRDEAPSDLRKGITEIAAKHSITLEKTLLGEPDETRPQFARVSVTFETKSKWPDLVKFVRDLQAPGQFVVLESLKLNIDDTDKTQMRGRFRVAKWFAVR